MCVYIRVKSGVFFVNAVEEAFSVYALNLLLCNYLCKYSVCSLNLFLFNSVCIYVYINIVFDLEHWNF